MKPFFATIIIAVLPLLCSAQKVKIGSTVTEDGGNYQGELLQGKPHGKGKTIYKNGNTYEGQYEKGKRQGFGTYTFFDGEKYEGEWLQGQQHGKGVYYFSNDNRYEGLWFRDYQHGHGIMYYFNGDKYDGNWYMDKRSGKGIYTFANGAYYKGDWKDDQKNGQGFFDWGDGSSYEGQWVNNVCQGKGTFKYASGDIYIGQWKNNVQNGHGIYKCQNGDVYEGNYVDGERTGMGVINYANGDKYSGQFQSGNKQGQGTFIWKNGDTYIGQWSANKPNGRGKLTTHDGDVYEGMFKNGIYEGVPSGSRPSDAFSYTEKWSGTGFALKGGYIITNYHVIYEASSINIYGIDGDFTNEIQATVIGTDKNNDIALLKIKGTVPISFNSIPYGFKFQIADVGEDIYVLGYPLTASMGEEIKLTNGIISAKSGFDGDVSQYQISAPVQPGNSGGPLIDYNGNIIGVVCAKHRGAENVSYAVKTSQVKNLIESISDLSIMNTTSKLQGKSLKEQVKLVNKYVYIIKCSK